MQTPEMCYITQYLCNSDNLSSVTKSIQPEENNDTFITCYGVEITSNTIKIVKTNNHSSFIF
jgi:hypothetical protein